MEGCTKLKPLRVKVSYPGLEYVMVLVQRNCLVVNLKKEIQDTLKQLFPARSINAINNLRKDNGRILLPDWYPVDPLLKDNEEVFINYESLIVDFGHCIDNGFYYSGNSQIDIDHSFEGEKKGTYAQTGFYLSQSMPMKSSERLSSHGSNPNLLKGTNESRMSDSDLNCIANRTTQFEYTSAIGKRKASEDIVPNALETRTNGGELQQSADPSFKKLKVDVLHNGEVTESESQLQPLSEKSILSLPSASSSSSPADTLVLDKTQFDEDTKLNAVCEKFVAKRCEVQLDISKNSLLNADKTLCPIQSAASDEDSKADDKADGEKKKAVDKKKRKKEKELTKTDFAKVGNREKKFMLEGLKDGSVIKDNKRRKRGKDSESESIGKLTASGKESKDKGINDSSPQVGSQQEETEKDSQLDSTKGLDFSEGNEITASIKEKKKKKKRKKSKEKEKSKQEGSLETLPSSSSITVSDVRESGIGSDSTVYDLEKRGACVSVENTLSPLLQRHDSAATKFQGSPEKQRNKVVKDPFGFWEAYSDVTRMSDDSCQNSGIKKGRKSELKRKQETIKSKTDFSNAIRQEEGCGKFKTPIAKVRKGGQAASPRKEPPFLSKKNDSSKGDTPKKNNPETGVKSNKPTFEYETDAEIGQIQSTIQKVMDEIVDDSDYSQSLIQEPQTLPAIDSEMIWNKDSSELVNRAICKPVGSRNGKSVSASFAIAGDIHETSVACMVECPNELERNKGKDSRKSKNKKGQDLESNKDEKSSPEKKSAKKKENSASSESKLKSNFCSKGESIISGSDSSSISFSDYDFTAISRKNVKKPGKSTSKGQMHSKIEDSGKDGKKKKEKNQQAQKKEEEKKMEEEREEIRKENDEVSKQAEEEQEGYSRKDDKKEAEKRHKKKGEKTPEKKQSDKSKAAKLDKDERISESKNEESRKRNGSSKALKKKKKRSRKSTETSMAKVHSWLSQIEDDVPTETELESEKEFGSATDKCIEDQERKFCPHMEKEDSGKKNTESLNVIGKESIGNPKGKGIVKSKDSDVKKDSGDKNKKTAVMTQENLSPDLDVSKNKASKNMQKVSTNGDDDDDDDDNYDNDRPYTNSIKKLSESPKTRSLAKKDLIADLNFDNLIWDGSSVISSVVKEPLQAKAGNTPHSQKPLTGFLSNADQKRFESKLQVRMSPRVRLKK